MLSGRYSKANNKYKLAVFDPSKPTIYTDNLEANNLYGKAKSYPMSQSGFTWLIDQQWQEVDCLRQTEQQTTGYFVECDLEYPPELIDSHNEYPLALERVAVSTSVLRDKEVEVSSHYTRRVPQNEVKLLSSLLNNVVYVTHYLNLKFYDEDGMKVRKFQVFIHFQKSRGLQPYIGKNTMLRASPRLRWSRSSTISRENSIYCKTCENQGKRCEIRLVTEKLEVPKLSSKPQ